MVIVASSMVRGRVRLATTSPQHGGQSHSVEGLKPKRSFVFRALFTACRGYTTYSQQSTVFAEETVWKTFLSALFIAFLEEKFSSYILQVFKHFWRDVSIKLSVYFSFVKELLMTDKRVTELRRERTINMSGTTTFPEMPVEFRF